MASAAMSSNAGAIYLFRVVQGAVFRVFGDFNFGDPDTIIGFASHHWIKNVVQVSGEAFTGAIRQYVDFKQLARMG